MLAHTSSPRVALLTGATGFIGSNLARQLVNHGWHVHVLVRGDSKLDALKDIQTSIHFHQVTENIENLADTLREIQPTCVFHIASLFLAQHTPNQINQLVQSNVNFPTQLLEAMRLAGVKRLINTGTSWQHFENSDYDPVNLYAATKQAFESIIQYYIEAHGLKVCTLKLFDTYGANDPRPKLVALLWKTAREGTTLDMSPGEQLVDLVHIKDVVEAYCRAADLLDTQTTGHVRYGVSSGNPMKLRDLVEAFERATNQRLPINWGGRPYRDREVMRLWRDYQTVPGWRPKIPFEIGILETAPNHNLQ
ncbi:NAD(P)-dependent oxidoreductase [Limnobacter sp. 130]|uniref:NAD-dependent epimerase/dehydratase family protein n=1 Tax=Limnobacter sp. 130 TaxID=2653147 RepID=UPI0012F38C9E|nr:NAD(P)-dependent oxidoreductase [Limnobacter sp. 130]VWX32686.1 conserved hypothetical protein [Limnobacter sp. 130]